MPIEVFCTNMFIIIANDQTTFLRESTAIPIYNESRKKTKKKHGKKPKVKKLTEKKPKAKKS